MEQQQIQNVIEKAIELLSCVNQNGTNETCVIPPDLQKEVDGAGILRSNSLTPNQETITKAIPFIKVREGSQNYPKIEYYCFIPLPFPLGAGVGYRLLGIDGCRKPVVVFEDFPQDIFDNGNRGAKINYAFLIPVK